MKGKELQMAIRGSGIKLSEIARMSKIPESTIYSLYKKLAVESHYLDKIKQAGVSLEETIKNEFDAEFYKKTVDNLVARLASVEGEVRVLREITAYCKDKLELHNIILDPQIKKRLSKI